MSSVCSTCQFWRKSRRNASFLIFEISFLKEVSQKSFVFELQSFNFEGSLAEMLRFWSSKLHFWRKSRRKASFWSFKASILKEVSQKCLVLEFQSFDFWRKSRRKASFFELHSFNFEGRLAEKLRLTTKSLEPQIIWHPNHLNLKSIDNQISWISNWLTTKSLESQINWQPNQLNLKSTDNHITWSSNQQTTEIIWSRHRLTTKSFESPINWQPKSFESQIRWQPNHLTLNSFESDINWLSNQLNSAHSLPIGSLSLETSATALCGRYVINLNFSNDVEQLGIAKPTNRQNSWGFLQKSCSPRDHLLWCSLQNFPSPWWWRWRSNLKRWKAEPGSCSSVSSKVNQWFFCCHGSYSSSIHLAIYSKNCYTICFNLY